LFIWLSNITPRLPRQPGVIGTHVTCEIFVRLHVEIFQGRFLEFSRSNQGGCGGPSIKGIRPSVGGYTRIATDSSSSSQFYAPSLLYPVVPLSTMQQIKGERCVRTTVGVLTTCTGAGKSGLQEVLRACALGFLSNTRGNFMSKSVFSVYCDDGLMVRSVIDSSFMR
jgi:hypothetical protein